MRKEPYDQILRALGQALEERNVHSFDLTASGDAYVLRGAQERKRGILKSLLGRWKGGDLGRTSDLTYTSRDIERLQRAGKARRGKSRSLPDFHSLSNVLRTVGAYIDLKKGHLLQLRMRDLTLTILYRTSQGQPEIEERDIGSFYELSMQMYGKRRTKSPR